MVLTPVLSEPWDVDGFWTVDVYREHGGYTALPKALGMQPDDIIAQVKDSGLRGRGGAGFPTGLKWSFVPQGDGKPHYLVVNADESEPGACKDIPMMLANPQALIECIAITCYAIRANHAFVYIRGEVPHVIRRMEEAVRQAYAAGFLGRNVLDSGFDVDLVVHAGAGAYICGEETALLDSLEGRRGQPRLKPPFPAVAGLYASPTVVNNVETIANVPYIVNNGVDWFRKFGTEKSPGFKLFAVSGHVARPGIYEAPLGVTMRELLDYAGGIRGGHQLKFWLPGGSSVPMLTADHLDTPLTYEDIAAAGSMLGTGTPMVFDETTSVVRAITGWLDFYKHESCGKCTPCREGTYWIAEVLHRFADGRGTTEELTLLEELCGQILGRSFCALGDAAATPYPPALKLFPDEFAAGAVVPSDHISATIDDIVVSVPKGTLVIRAAEQLGIEIPRFCDHPLLDPVAACRMCLIEIEGMPKPQPACAIQLTDGMVVRTQMTSSVAEVAQKGVMEFLLIKHPLDCPVCDKGGECPLQNQAMTAGRVTSRFDGTKRTVPKPINVSAQGLLDR